MIAMLVVGAFVAVPAVTMAQETATPPPTAETATEATQAANGSQADENETRENETDPGAHLLGVVGVGEAELDGEIQSRTFGIRVAQAANDGARAAVIGEQLNDSEQRLRELQQRKETLRNARENGSMSEGEYRAKIARLHAETKNVERLTNETSETASGLPAATLEERGINTTRITMLSDRASELSGGEVARVARGIAGQNVGDQVRPDRASDRGNAGAEVGPELKPTTADRTVARRHQTAVTKMHPPTRQRPAATTRRTSPLTIPMCPTQGSRLRAVTELDPAVRIG